jgi:hypothetical protein
MKGDFSRLTFREHARYSGVLMQQGRVQVDADWNEQLATQRYLDETEATDVIGPSGAPKHAPGFRICVDPCGELSIGKGRFYVDGILVVNDCERAYADQPDYPHPPAVRDHLADGQAALVYLDVWHRHVTALEDPRLKEVALGGADTATRMKTIWQVKILPLALAAGGTPAAVAGAPPQCCAGCGGSTLSGGCDAQYPEWDQLLRPAPPKLAARTQPQPPEAPCLLPPSAGYLRLENQLYRVEVHAGSATSAPSLKWSRDNGIVVTAIEELNGALVTVRDLGRDSALGFESGQWVELFDRGHELRGEPGALAEVLDINVSRRQITLRAATGFVLDKTLAPRLRRWDQRGPGLVGGAVPVTPGWIALEDGIEVQLGATGSHRTGDYWLIPARTATGSIEWPPFEAGEAPLPAGPSPKALPPFGIRHHYCRLALIQRQGTALRLLDDCRKIFAPLTELDSVRADLKLHNRYLHGKGVVYGLALRCAGQAQGTLSLAPGYALAPDGADLFVDSATSVDVAGLASSLLQNGSGEIEITLAEGAGRTPVIGVRKYDPPKPFLAQILDGTLLSDAFDRVLKPLFELVKGQLSEPRDTEPGAPLVGPPTRRRIALLNAFARFSAKNGNFVFASRLEHEALKEVYDALRAAVHSASSCAMSAAGAGLGDFPEYFDPTESAGVTTYFGNSQASKVRIDPSSATAYTFGGHFKDRLHVFNLDATEDPALAEIITLTGEVLDVTFLEDNRVVAVTYDGSSSTLWAFPRAGQRQIEQVVTHDGKLTRLQAVRGAGEPQQMCALVVDGQQPGVWLLEPNGERNPQSRHDPEVTGYMEVAQLEGQLFACVTVDLQRAQAGAPAPHLLQRPRYNGIRLYPVARDSESLTYDLRDRQPGFSLGQDGLALCADDERGQLRIALEVEQDGSANRFVLPLIVPVSADGPSADGPFDPTGQGPRDVHTDGSVSLCWGLDQLLLFVARARELDVARFGVTDQVLTELQPPLPAQLVPTSIAQLAGDAPRTVLFNRASNTLSLYRNERFDVLLGERNVLASYRDQVARALINLGVALVQHVKDGLCNVVLQESPSVESGQPIAIGHAKLQGWIVRRVCNIPRDEVVTFPKLGYWLSAIPVLPALGYLLEQICCAILPQAPRDLIPSGRGFSMARRDSRLPASQARGLVAPTAPASETTSSPRVMNDQWVTFDIQATEDEIQGRIALIERHLRNWVSFQLRRLVTLPQARQAYEFDESRLALGYTQLLDRPFSVAREYLSGLEEPEHPDPRELPYTRALQELSLDQLLAPIFFYGRDAIDLYTQSTSVSLASIREEAELSAPKAIPPAPNAASPSPPAPPVAIPSVNAPPTHPPPAPAPPPASPVPEFDRLRGLVEQHLRELATRDQELAAMRESLARLTTQLSEWDSLKAKLLDLERAEAARVSPGPA